MGNRGRMGSCCRYHLNEKFSFKKDTAVLTKDTTTTYTTILNVNYICKAFCAYTHTMVYGFTVLQVFERQDSIENKLGNLGKIIALV